MPRFLQRFQCSPETLNFIVLTKISHKARFFLPDSEQQSFLYVLLQSPSQSQARTHNVRCGLWPNRSDKNAQTSVRAAAREWALLHPIHTARHAFSLFLKPPQPFRSADCDELHCPAKSKPAVSAEPHFPPIERKGKPFQDTLFPQKRKRLYYF